MNDLDVNSRQDRFHHDLSRFMGGQAFSNAERLLLYRFAGNRIRKKCARKIRSSFIALKNELVAPTTPRLEKQVPIYAGNNDHVISLKSYLDRHMSHYLIGAYVHGSLGTYEEIAYSDFDALVVVRDDVFSSDVTLADFCCSTIRAARILWNYDPLQHHGFFVLTETDLNHFAESYFPAILFDHAKSLLGDRDQRIELHRRDEQACSIQPLHRMLDAIDAKINSQRIPTNYQTLKMLLSQLMLLPSLYSQARGRPVFKRESFAAVKGDFGEDEWAIIDEASELRQHWDFVPTSISKLISASSMTPFWTVAYEKKFGRRLSREMASHLNDQFYNRILRFTSAARRLVPDSAAENQVNR